MGVEDGLPELIETNGAAFIHVEHPDHHFDSMWVEAGEVAVYERGSELFLG